MSAAAPLLDSQLQTANAAGPVHGDDSASVSTVQEESDEVWCDARDTPADDISVRESMDVPGDELDDEDRDHSGSAPGIGADDLSEEKDMEEQAIGKPTPQNIITTSLEPISSSVTSPADSEPNGLSGLSGEYVNDPPLAQSTPELSSAARSAQRSAQSLDVTTPYTAERANSPTPTSHSTGLDRQNSRRRSTADSRAANRLSGFFSHLMSRRPEREGMGSSSSFGRVREESEAIPTPKDDSRASSPMPGRPITPPPSLPSPSLNELGLSLTAITAQLAPSHFNTPPTSGTFLKPHYLLLCHSQGLDVLPLVSPPAPQPYALVRRVGFKSVVVMEHRGVLVAIAGRRDGVRVYALEEVKKAVEWRIDVEIRRERERLRREEAKKGITGGVDKVFGDLVYNPQDKGKLVKASNSLTPSASTAPPRDKRRKSVSGNGEIAPQQPLPRAPTTRRPRRRSQRQAHHDTDPPPYTSTPRPQVAQNQPSAISVNQTRSRAGSISNVLAGSTVRRRSSVAPHMTSQDEDAKGDWEHTSSDEEAINMATAGPSGSAALDERTSSVAARSTTDSSSHANEDGAVVDIASISEPLPRSSTSTSHSINRRNRPPHLELSRVTSITSTVPTNRPPPSPTPTIWTLRQALTANPNGDIPGPSATPDPDGEDDEDEGADSVSFAQMLMESRLPDLPPPGSRREQEPIMISPTLANRPSTPTASETHSRADSIAHSMTASQRSRRRWSVLDGVFSQSGGATESGRSVSTPLNRTPSRSQSRPDMTQRTEDSGVTLTRVRSAEANRTSPRQSPVRRPSTSQGRNIESPAQSPPPLPQSSLPSTPMRHRFLPRIFTNALRRSDGQSSNHSKSNSNELSKRSTGNSLPPLPPAPKLEYIKLPGTKGSLMIKAVETARKSFLAILCGENGDKVELFAGTYRTSLGLSRTFLLPDPPRAFELQLQGDDLVEIFLIFAQSVFGLEPATVRVREVRIGRAERRAARRRARETRVELNGTEAEGPALGDEENPVNVRVGVTFTPSASAQLQGSDDNGRTPPMSRQESESNIAPMDVQYSTISGSNEFTLPGTQLAPYTTFQQLSFAPQFPLATIADDYVIPPTYLSFLEYRAEHESEGEGSNNIDLASVQFTPPGLPVPPVLPPSKWYYRDPSGSIQGPWKASLMQHWYKSGLLPPNLPVRREEDLDYVLLKDLRAQSVDPSHPFRLPPPPLPRTPLPLAEPQKPLLDPLSLLTQSRYYGPPALFFTTRGGNSTSIVDARGRSVLKGRLQWSSDDDDPFALYGSKLGDVKRLEAFDAANKALVVAIRQGGLEVADVGEAIMKPGDLSRMTLSGYNPADSSFKRREPFIWRIGSPLSPFAAGPVSSISLPMSVNPQTPSKKSGLPTGKSPAKSEFVGISIHDNDNEGRINEELLFLGRSREDVYCCERTSGSFRILRLCPNPSLS